MAYHNLISHALLDETIPGWNMLQQGEIEKYFGFSDTGDNVIGIRNIERAGVAKLHEKSAPVSLPAIRKNYEIGPNGVVEVPRIPLSAHITRAGTPHRTQHVFGYWHINDKDEIIIPLPPNGDIPARILIIMGMPLKNVETDKFAWYCDKCLTLLFMRESSDFADFWSAELSAVREYNADPENRVCKSCGHVNHVAYSAMQELDTDEERGARFQW